MCGTRTVSAGIGTGRTGPASAAVVVIIVVVVLVMHRWRVVNRRRRG